MPTNTLDALGPLADAAAAEARAKARLAEGGGSVDGLHEAAALYESAGDAAAATRVLALADHLASGALKADRASVELGDECAELGLLALEREDRDEALRWMSDALAIFDDAGAGGRASALLATARAMATREGDVDVVEELVGRRRGLGREPVGSPVVTMVLFARPLTAHATQLCSALAARGIECAAVLPLDGAAARGVVADADVLVVLVEAPDPVSAGVPGLEGLRESLGGQALMPVAAAAAGAIPDGWESWRGGAGATANALAIRIRRLAAIDLGSLSAREFEGLVFLLFQQVASAVVEPRGSGVHDMAVDLIVDFERPFPPDLEPGRYFVQIKHHVYARVEHSSLRFPWEGIREYDPRGRMLFVLSGRLTSVARDELRRSPERDLFRVLEGPQLRTMLLFLPEVADRFFGRGVGR